MSEEQEKRMAQNYEITQAIHIGDKEVVFGIDEASEKPYFCAFYEKEYQIIQFKERYVDCIISDSYVEVVELFAQRVQEQCEKVREEWAKVMVPREKITAAMCFPNDYRQNLLGKVVAVKPEILRPEYQSADHQLIFITGVNGAHENSRGTACFCKNLYTGEDTRWERYDILGEVRPEHLPAWAKDRLAEIQKEQAEKERRTKSREGR